MSLRHLKRIEQENAAKVTVSGDDDDSEETQQTPKKKSVFQLLADASESDEEVAEVSPSTTNGEQTSAALGDTAAGKKKTKKQKAKKNKRKQKQQEELDDLEKELNFIEDPSQKIKVVPINESHDIRSVLSFQAAHLNATNELRRKFGAAVIREERQQQPKVLNKRSTIRSLFVPDSAWHQQTLHGRKIGGISMKPTDRIDYFEYEYSSDYWMTQAEFMYLVNSFSHQELFQMQFRVGDHIDTLIQASEICIMEEDKAKAAELIERAVYILEKAFHSSFSFQEGRCRLDYRCKPNRSLFIVLFLHAYSLSEKGCPRTALEISKLILAMDPEYDPLAVLLVIDNFALRSQQYAWLAKFFDAFQKAGKNLHQLPNFAFSIALAEFHLKNYDKADKLLEDAMLTFPQVFKAIVDKNSIMLDRKTADVFDKYYPDDLIVKLYSERCAWMFKESSVLRWMEKVSTKLVSDGAQPRSIRTVGPIPRNVLRHVNLAHVPGVTLSSQHLPTDSDASYNFDPFPPKNSYGDLTPKLPDLSSSDILSDSTLANLLNSLNPGWNGEEDAGVQAGANLRQGVGTLVDAILDLMDRAVRPAAADRQPADENAEGGTNEAERQENDD